MANAKPGQERVDGSHLKPFSPTPISEVCRLDIVGAIRDQEGKGIEVLKDCLSGLRSGEALQELLENEAGGDHQPATLQGVTQCVNLRLIRGSVPAKGVRPHARVHEKAHGLERSAL